MTKTTTRKQIEDWKTELALAMVNRQWRRALQLCSWLRYTLRQQELSDPEVEEAHRQAKEALAGHVSRVEIMLIDPPEDIKRAMHKQKTAEQERRAMRLLATGEFEAAEQQKLATIQRAEGERAAAIKVAEGKAEAIRLVNEAGQKYFRGNAQALKQIEMTENALRDNTQIVIAEEGIKPTLLLGS